MKTSKATYQKTTNNTTNKLVNETTSLGVFRISFLFFFLLSSGLKVKGFISNLNRYNNLEKCHSNRKTFIALKKLHLGSG